jgi:hypothetical protein
LDYRDCIDCTLAALGQLSPFSEPSKLPGWIEPFVLGFEKLELTKALTTLQSSFIIDKIIEAIFAGSM